MSAAELTIAQAQGAEKIFRGGPILTMEDGQRQVEAVAIAGGRIIATGTEAEVMASATDATEIVDLNGNTLMPSFIDAHGHFMNAPQIVQWANVSGPPVGPVETIPDIIEALNAHVEQLNIQSGEWIIGYGYDINNLKEGRELSRNDLDPHFPDNPVLLIHVSNHGAVLNSKAFAAVGIDASTPTPPGGLILRQAGSNEPDGLLMETAFLPVFANLPQPSEEELLDTLDAAQQIYASAGVTTCQEGATHAKDLKFLLKAAEQERFYLDIYALPMVLEVPTLVREYFPSFANPDTELPDTASESFGTYNNRLKLQGVKMIVDGSPQGKTAFWSEPLLTDGPGGEKNWRGEPLFPPEVINRAAKELYDKGIQVFTHCNGDAAIDMMIDAARAAGVTAADDARTVIIHSQFMRPDQLDAYVELGFTPSFFTVHAFYWGDVHIANTGKERSDFISPMVAAQKKGIRFTNHSDFSVTPMEPMRMAWSAVARTSRTGQILGPDQRVDMWTSLKALTIDAAWQIREDDSKGSIAPGKLADLVILDGNPMTVTLDDVLNIQVVETFKEGNSVYRQEMA